MSRHWEPTKGRLTWLFPAAWGYFLLLLLLAACRADPFPSAARPQVEPTPTAAPRGDIRFEDAAQAVGLDFAHGAFARRVYQDPQAAMGGGLCWLDFDNDGWHDLYLVNSHATAEASLWQDGLPANALYRNQEGSFVDVSRGSGADLALRGMGCVAADFNRDGLVDLFVSADGPDALLWNLGDGRFAEGAAPAGVAAPEWNSAAVVGDLNRDGWPDLFVAAYIDLDKQVPKPVGAFPQDYYGLPDHLYLNRGADASGRVTFEDVTAAAGLVREERGLGALFSDLDQDGDLDLYIANDGHPNRLYANEPDPTHPLGFRLLDWTETSGVGDAGSGMGVAGGDYDGDGWTDLFITNWERELNALYRNESNQGAPLVFQYSTFRIGVSGLGNGYTGWGAHLADFDQDGDSDLLIVNGRVPVTNLATDPELARYYRNRTLNLDGSTVQAGFFYDWTEQVGLKAVGPLLGRGSAAADFDRDGDLDVAVNRIGGPVLLLRNEGDPGNWLQVSLAGFQPGGWATVRMADGRILRREIYAGSSYLASEDPTLHFGLGRAEEVAEVRVGWPDGTMRTLAAVKANQRLDVSP